MGYKNAAKVNAENEFVTIIKQKYKKFDLISLNGNDEFSEWEGIKNKQKVTKFMGARTGGARTGPLKFKLFTGKWIIRRNLS